MSQLPGGLYTSRSMAVATEAPLSPQEIGAVRLALRQWTLQSEEAHGESGRRYPASLSSFFIYGQQERLPEPRPTFLPGRVSFWTKSAGLIAVMVGLYYGPSYVGCRQMKEQGLFYFGSTISTCMKERIEERTGSFEALARKLIPAL